MLNILTRLLGVLIFSSIAGADPEPSLNESSASIERRQCVSDPNNRGQWLCDDQLPTLNEIIARMQDTRHKGQVDSTHHAVFVRHSFIGSLALTTSVYQP